MVTSLHLSLLIGYQLSAPKRSSTTGWFLGTHMDYHAGHRRHGVAKVLLLLSSLYRQPDSWHRRTITYTPRLESNRHLSCDIERTENST